MHCRRVLVVLAVAAALALTLPPPAVAQDDMSAQELFNRGLAEFEAGRYGHRVAGVPGHPHGALYWFDLVKREIGNLADEGQRARLASMLVREAGYGLVLRMQRLQHNEVGVAGEMRAFARWLLSTSTREAGGWTASQRRDQDSITNALMRAMRDPNPGERLRWMEVVRNRHGEFAVPAIHRMFLHCGNPELEGRAMHLLTMIGLPAVAPVIEIMDSANVRDRQHASHVLGDLNDQRAVPVLVEHLKGDESQAVKTECQIALEKILGPVGSEGDLLAPAEYYYSLALKYYHQLPELAYGRTDAFVLWRWVPQDPHAHPSAGHLDYDHRVPMWGYMDAMAEEACLDALRLNPSYSEAWDLLVDVNLRQWLEADARYFDGVASMRDDNNAQREVTDADEGFAVTYWHSHRGLVLGAPAGQRALFRALRRALIDRLPEVAVAVIGKIAEVGDDRYIPLDSDYDPETGRIRKAGAPLIEALTYDDKRVRYAAAQALFRLHNNRIVLRNEDGSLRRDDNGRPTYEPFFGISEAKRALIQGLGETSQRSIQVITDNLDLRNNMRSELLALGYYVYFAETPADGLQRALSFPGDDLILIDAHLANQPLRVWASHRDQFRAEGIEDSETIFDILADDFRTSEVPIVLMCQPDDETRYRNSFRAEFNARNAQLLDVLHYSTSNQINATAVDLGVFTPIWERSAVFAENRADAVAIGCAEAIRGWDPDRAPRGFFTPVIQALVARIHDPRRNTAVKVAMLQTLAHFCEAKDATKYEEGFWDRDVIRNLLPVLVRPSTIDPPIVKLHVCRALAAIYRNRVGEVAWPGRGFQPASDRNRPEYDADGNPVGNWVQNPFWVLYELIDYDTPEVLGESINQLWVATVMGDPQLRQQFEDAMPDDMASQTWMIDWVNDVLAVRAAAAEVLGCAPMTDAQRLYLYTHKRVHRREAVNFGDRNN